ncbi:MAG: LemA family protein [Bacillaceae bacterium]|uniref:LemA family protein n=1 Tax=Alkalihalobacterium chitinilyticum TaxID=2980103 RepID=A0ABT5VJ75_9BACI|nr:LemA family protein [Alkalihalobacterium chitinilyticum]MDE5415506.1 LemA family protein [Alkalihalobacterium chitinilyticum]MEB1809374.1 LemA family protein [Bacillaceae bacterium]
MTTLIVVLLLIAILIPVSVIIYLWLSYNKLVRHEQYVKTAWSNIDNQLDAKYRILTNVVQMFELGSDREKDFVESALLARKGLTSKSVKEKAVANENVNSLLPQMSMLMEAYPNSNVAHSLKDAMASIKQAEEKITYARTGYNGGVENYNILIRSFPTNLIASKFGHTPKESFSITEEERKVYNHLSVNDVRSK